MISVLSIILAYLIGSISTSTLVTRWRAHVDVRKVGSGNAGATNTLRILGWRWALFVLAVDAAKGALAVGLAYGLGVTHLWVICLAAVAVVAGHNWPVWFSFRGGKGVATTIGVYLVLLPLPVLVAAVIAVIIIAVSRYVSLGSMILLVLTVVMTTVLVHNPELTALAGVLAAFSIFRHRTNILRLIQGKEHRIFNKQL